MSNAGWKAEIARGEAISAFQPALRVLLIQKYDTKPCYHKL